MLRHETKPSTEVTRFNRYFINNNNKKKKEKEKEKMKINIIIINYININNDNNNSTEDLDSLPMTEPQYRFSNSKHVVIRELLHFVA